MNNTHARTVTPTIDKLAQTGISFTDAHSGGAVCIPSRYSLLTGRYFFREEWQKKYMAYFPPLIESGRETIGSLMQKAGYSTACVGKWHLGLDWELKEKSEPLIPDTSTPFITNVDFSKPIKNGPNNLGFDYSFILPGSLDMPPYVFIENGKVLDPDIVLTADNYPLKLEDTSSDWDRKYTDENDIYWDRGIWWRNGEMSRSFKFEDCLDNIADHGLAFIEKQVKEKPNKPFLLYLALTAPHTPWLPSPQFKGTSSLGTYGDFVSQIDNIVLQVKKKLESLGIADNTIIIFSSDNGAQWEQQDILHYAHQSNWGRRGQKGDIWDGGHHIPLIISWPLKFEEPLVYSETVGLIDVFATLSEMTNQELDAGEAEDSFSFLSVLNGDLSTPTRDHIIYLSSSGKLAIKKGQWKFIDCLGSGGFSHPSKLLPVKNGPTGQLYNLVEDPLENNNLFLQKSDTVKNLSSILKRIASSGYSRKETN